jgi:NTP pyrophosphatase (non-canonical NTP hydrolase)
MSTTMDELQAAVGLWHVGAFPHEHPLELALCSAEEIGELAEALDQSKALQALNTRLTRAFLKESHGTNDRRADVDWTAQVFDEMGDVLVVFAAIAAKRGWSLEEMLRVRFEFVRARYPGPAS